MNKLRLIIAREYMSIVGRKSFILMTLGMPLLFIIIGAVPMLLGYLNDKGSPTQLISVVDETGRYGAALHSDEMYTYVIEEGMTATSAHEFYQKSDDGIDAMVIIPRDVDSTGMVNILSKGTITPALVTTVRSAIADTIESAHLASMGIPNLQEMVDKAHVNVDVRSIKLSEEGEQESSTDIAMGLGLWSSLCGVFTILSMFVFYRFYGLHEIAKCHCFSSRGSCDAFTAAGFLSPERLHDLSCVFVPVRVAAVSKCYGNGIKLFVVSTHAGICWSAAHLASAA